MVRVPGGAVTGAALVPCRGKPHLKSRWGGPEFQEDLGSKVEVKKGGEKQVGAEGSMDSQSVQKAELQWTDRSIRPHFSGTGNNHSGV